jgi:hypothetical protein
MIRLRPVAFPRAWILLGPCALPRNRPPTEPRLLAPGGVARMDAIGRGAEPSTYFCDGAGHLPRDRRAQAPRRDGSLNSALVLALRLDREPRLRPRSRTCSPVRRAEAPALTAAAGRRRGRDRLSFGFRLGQVTVTHG